MRVYLQNFILLSLVIMNGNGYKRSQIDIPSEECYPGLGCVILTSEWTHHKYRPSNVMPAQRRIVNTLFVKWELQHERLQSDILGSSFTCQELPAAVSNKLIIHGFMGNGYLDWIQELVSAIKSKNIFTNVLTVDWVAGAEPPYLQAIANARLVALEIANFLSTCRIYQNIHLIGYGVGAHIAGYVGKMTKVDHITALDPSGLYFIGMPPNVRLFKEDAKYVEVLHTDNNGEGYKHTLGHIDYFANGGKRQPGCKDFYVSLKKIKRGDFMLGETLERCSHLRSAVYYIEALTNPLCNFVAISCKSFGAFIRGSCNRCGMYGENCAQLSVSYDKPRVFNNAHGYHFITAATPPFCGEILRVNLSLQQKQSDVNYKGYFNVTVQQFGIGDVNFHLNENDCLSGITENHPIEYTVFRTSDPPLMLPAKCITLQWIPYLFTFYILKKNSPQVASLVVQKIGSENPLIQCFSTDTSSLEAFHSLYRSKMDKYCSFPIKNITKSSAHTTSKIPTSKPKEDKQTTTDHHLGLNLVINIINEKVEGNDKAYNVDSMKSRTINNEDKESVISTTYDVWF